MASLPSGFRKDAELVKIETARLSLLIKGKPFHERYEGLKQYRSMDVRDRMEFHVRGEDVHDVLVFDVDKGELSPSSSLKPIFFENGVYQIVAIPKKEGDFSFYHEHPQLRQAVSAEKLGSQTVLIGNLHFQNEVGYTSFAIRDGGKTILEVTFEIFPVKLDYKKDYEKLLEEVTEEIYNLAFHFIRKTYVKTSLKLDGKPSRSEFFRLITAHFGHFLQALRRIELQPHHKLEKTYEKVRGDQLGKLDSVSRSYLRKRPGLFAETKNGVVLAGRKRMPVSGLRIRKTLTADTLENRYVKWMIERLIHKLDDLLDAILRDAENWQKEAEHGLVNEIGRMKKSLEDKLNSPFWRNIGKLDRSVMSLVIQMAPGYRDAYQIFLTVSKGLMLRGKLYRMSVKDVALLYEYWTFLKMGQILSRKYEMVSQDIVKVKRDGLFVVLDTNRTARRVFRHPVTNEEIILTYQKKERNLPTVSQMPDTMLSIQKKGKDYLFNYIFDAKYRIDYAQEGSWYERAYGSPGPLEEDINTMHRYRDAIVAANGGPYERTMFGAYVLFPWFYEESYVDHPFYKSIEEVNIGGLPFLPNATCLVERFVERLIDKSPEEIHREGILPKGTLSEWKSSLEEKVLVGLVAAKEDYGQFLKNGEYFLSNRQLKKGWQEAKYVALYVKEGVARENGVAAYGKIEHVAVSRDSVRFKVDHWRKLHPVIKPVGYGIASYMMTTLDALKDARELPELFMKSPEEKAVWRMLRRVSDQIKVELDKGNVDEASRIIEYGAKDLSIRFSREKQIISFIRGRNEKEVPFGELRKNAARVFKALMQMFVQE